MELIDISMLSILHDNPHSIVNNSYRELLITQLKINEDGINKLDDMLKSVNFVRSMNTFISTYEEQISIRPDMIEHIKYLQMIDQPQQRTQEWYDFRYNHITASNAWKAYSTKEKEGIVNFTIRHNHGNTFSILLEEVIKTDIELLTRKKAETKQMLNSVSFWI